MNINFFSKSLFAALTLFTTSFLTANLCLPFAGDVGLGYDYFRSLPEGDWEGNTGAFASFNAAMELPEIYCTELGVQLGTSYGVYDFCGRGSAPSSDQGASQTQLFVTTALFNAPCNDYGIRLGLAYDWMRNTHFGVFGVQTSFDQLRFQGGYTFCESNEAGIWATLNLHTSHKNSSGVPVLYRAISQVNFFWKHHFENRAQTMIWAGLPYKKSLMYSTGRAGQYILGASFESPLTQRFSVAGHACYMKGHSAEGALKQRNYGANICLEVKWAFGKEETAFVPYMDLANNSNFLVDTNTTF